MTTCAPPLLLELAADWKNECGFRSAVFSGCVGDSKHQERGGYHIGRRFQPKDNYSVVRPDDRIGPDVTAAALDMSMSPADMRLCTARLVAVYGNLSDPRRKYINAANGTLNNKTARRWDFYARVTARATIDHLQHVHLEVRRKYVDSPTAMKAVLSVLKGHSSADYLKATGVSLAVSSTSVPPPIPSFPGVLKRDDSQSSPNNGVKQFQARMIARGWASTGTADGFFGEKLESVVKRWQAVVGLTPDGVIGAKTWPTPWTRPLGK